MHYILLFLKIPRSKLVQKRRLGFPVFEQILLVFVEYHFHSHRKFHSGPRQRSRYSDSLRAGRSGDRIPVEARFSAPVQTCPGDHPASYTMGTGSFPGVKQPGRGVDHRTHIAPRLKKE